MDVLAYLSDFLISDIKLLAVLFVLFLVYKRATKGRKNDRQDTRISARTSEHYSTETDDLR